MLPQPVVGVWREAAPGGAHLTFGDDGTVLGSDGCNPVNGTYTLRGDTLSFTLGFTTLVACPGVTVSFVRLGRAHLEGDELHTFAVDGSEIVTLQRDE